MKEELEQRLPFLVGSSRVGEERYRTLRTALDWSYRLLAPELQQVFFTLSVFYGSCSVQAAKTVCACPSAQDALDELAACSLLSREWENGETRYRMLETIREFAQEKLRECPEKWNATVLCHRASFIDLAEMAAPHLLGSEQKLWLDRLEIEYSNFAAILSREVPDPAPPQESLQLGAFFITPSLRSFAKLTPTHL